jgi:hypothetical protein
MALYRIFSYKIRKTCVECGKNAAFGGNFRPFNGAFGTSDSLLTTTKTCFLERPTHLVLAGVAPDRGLEAINYAKIALNEGGLGDPPMYA